jgi:hypothetical protein
MTAERTAILSRLIAMGMVWAGLVVWQTAAAIIDCPLALVFVIAVWTLSILAASEPALLRRRAFAALYLNSGGRLFRLLRRWTLQLLWIGARTLLPTLLLLITALSLDGRQWALLLADVVLLTLWVSLFGRLLHREVRSGYREPIARLWAQRVNALLLWVALLANSAFSTYEDYKGLSWNEVVRYAASQPQTACNELALLARLSTVGQALALWAAQNLLPGLARLDQAVVAWAFFLTSLGVSFLVAWAYSRTLMGVWVRPWRIWQVEPSADTTPKTRGPAPATASRPRLAGWFWGGFIAVLLLGLLVSVLASVRSGVQRMEVALSDHEPLPPAWTEAIRVTLRGGDAVLLDPQALAQVQTQGLAWIGERQRQLQEDLRKRVARETEAIFGQASHLVPAFADWYYSLTGEYTRLLVAAFGNLSGLVAEKMNALVFQPADTVGALDRLSNGVDAELTTQLRVTVTDLQTQVERWVRESRAAQPQVEVWVSGELHLDTALAERLTPLLTFSPADIARQGVAATAGAAASGLAMKKLGAATVAEVAGKVGAKASAGALGTVAAKFGLKSAAKAGGGAGAFAGGAAAGAGVCAGTVVGAPLVPGCALVGGTLAGLTSWLLVDKAVLEADELMHREALEADLRAALAEQQEEVRKYLEAQMLLATKTVFDKLRAAFDQGMRPAAEPPKKDFVPGTEAAAALRGRSGR